MKKMCALALAVLLAGCVSVGTNFSESAADQLQPGMSFADVESLLGKPMATSVNYSSGITAATWMHTTGNALGQARSRSVTLTFDRDNKLIGVNRAETQVN